MSTGRFWTVQGGAAQVMWETLLILSIVAIRSAVQKPPSLLEKNCTVWDLPEETEDLAFSALSDVTKGLAAEKERVEDEEVADWELCVQYKNKAKAISAELLELIFKNKLEETGKTRWNGKKEITGEKKTWKPEETE